MRAEADMEENAAMDPDTETFETMTAGLVKHIFGAGEKGIIEHLRKSQDLPKDIGVMAYTMTSAAAEQGKNAGKEIDLEMALGVAAEVIDSLLQVAEAMGLIESADDEAMRDDAMLAAVEAYSSSGEVSPEEQEAAQQMLAQMTDDGSVDEAVATIGAIGKRRGEDPFADDEPVDEAAPAGQPPAQGAAPRAPLMQE
jgi:hypothetical protein